jgi:hypothetical protein
MSCRGIVRLLRKVSLNLVLIGGGVGFVLSLGDLNREAFLDMGG